MTRATDPAASAAMLGAGLANVPRDVAELGDFLDALTQMLCGRAAVRDVGRLSARLRELHSDAQAVLRVALRLDWAWMLRQPVDHRLFPASAALRPARR